ncbi:hypothetical protein [Daejeonella sp.]|uniref:hypothetical protein n=1 Tax=Daejeonella sp. TaxID=2805397 RepID=UPI00272F05D9|nr:hypothetical protein [Daejeonella sp.]MDP2414901.1 hypothetical protein [Daejeonella sp.]
MHIKVKFCLIILSVFLISCNNQNKESELHSSEHNEIISKGKQEPIIEEMIIDKSNIIDQLQGKWKENEYPYRTVEFLNSTVKFLEEGTQNKPKFEKFELSEDCQFDNNNIRDLKSGDVILSLPENKRCEKLKVSNDTLILSGFSTNTKEDYKIRYLKLKF